MSEPIPNQPCSILCLPNELLLEIIKTAGEDCPRIKLRIWRQLCQLFARFALPLMFRHLRLVADEGCDPLARHVAFFKKARLAASEVRTLEILGAEEVREDGQGGSSFISADNVACAARDLPALEKLVLRDFIWFTNHNIGPYPALPSLHTIEFQETTLRTPGPFPANVLRVLSHIQHAKVSFATWFSMAREFDEAIELSNLHIDALSFEATDPFPAGTIQAAVIADQDSLRSLTIEFTPIQPEPEFEDIPADVSLACARKLHDAHFLLPATTFPTEAREPNLTWKYAARMIRTVPADTPQLTITFDFSTMSVKRAYAKLMAFPASDLEDAVSRFAPSTQIDITIQNARDDGTIEWRGVLKRSAAWRKVANRVNVNVGTRRLLQRNGPFAYYYPWGESDDEDKA